MCTIILINRGFKELTTPRQFKQHFGFLPHSLYKIEMDYCLCQCDIEETLKANNIPFKTYCGDFFVGELAEVVGDDD